MNSLETLMYLMGEKIYGNPSGCCDEESSGQPDVNSGRLVVAGPVPSWIEDLLILLPDFKLCEDLNLRSGDVVLVTDPQSSLRNSGIRCIIGYKGKKTLWNSILASGVLHARSS